MGRRRAKNAKTTSETATATGTVEGASGAPVTGAEAETDTADATGNEADAPDGTSDDDSTPDDADSDDDGSGADSDEGDEGDDDEGMSQLAPLPPPKERRHTGRHIAQCVLRHGETVMTPGNPVTGFSQSELAELERQGHVVAETHVVD
ncbi:MAG TPA: hypothetical protein VH062_02255 [Polyangiaceae bacterium]|jgi:hypothetical protein|nr:hypothetical protein [Polyangiaceae bacterium]